ncbi:hypothetical protein T02_12901 [Trichinella nativa]|uniref:Uncharacterized protein n=1 Tax=Trichinella nativa TaxID=6335 RepID=A0A0V1L7F0_9BILA|nr:hypothetical protein T02_12901 [Trichinella nativa]
MRLANCFAFGLMPLGLFVQGSICTIGSNAVSHNSTFASLIFCASLAAGLSVQCGSLMHAVCVCEKGEQQLPEALTKYDRLVKKTKWRQYAVS